MTYKWALYFLLQQGWQQLYLLLRKIKSYDRDYIDLYSNEDAVFAKQSTDRFVELLDGIKNIGVPYGIVLFPHSGYPIKSNPFNFMHRRVLDICDKRNILCLDQREAYAPFDDRVENLWASKFDQHPNAIAHGIAARKIYDFFAPKWQNELAEQH